MAKKPALAGVVDAAAFAASQLDALGAPFALIGGLAVSARAEPRYTRDVDLAIAVADDREAERLLFALASRGYSVVTVLEQARSGRLSTARLRHARAPEIFVDLLFASSGIEPEIASSSEPIAYRPGTTLPIAKVGHLIALKVLSESERRLQDRIDLGHLGGVATADDWATAVAAVRLIKARSYHRGRALLTRLRRWKAESARLA